MRRAVGMTRQLKTHFGRIHRDIVRKAAEIGFWVSRLIMVIPTMDTPWRQRLNKLSILQDLKVDDAYVDLGHRGHDYRGMAKINIVNLRM